MAGELERLLIRVEADTAALRRALANADKDVAGFANKVDRQAARIEARFRTLMAGFSGVYLAREAVRASDAYTLMGNRLAVVTKSASELNYVQERLFSTAQNTRIDITELNELYARMAFALKDVGVSTNDVLKLTENLSKAMIVSGATQAEAAGALQQLSQGLAAGTLRGQELNSVMEQLPYVAGMIADKMGVTIGELRKLGEQGKLTGKEVFNAILQATDEIDAKFAKTTPTIAQGFSQMGNSLLEFVGLVGKATGASSGLAVALGSVAGGIRDANKELKETGTLSIWEQIKNVPQWIVDRLAMKPIQNGGPNVGLKGSVFDVDAFGQAQDGFDPNAKGVDRTPAALDPWAASIIPPSAEEQLREMKDAWAELREVQMLALDDLIGDKTETAAAKMAALTEAVKAGRIGWQDYATGVEDVKEQTERANDAMLSSTSHFLDTMFANNKTAATASALINTYQGITKALSEYPPPYSYAMAAMQAAMGFQQVRAIQSTSKNSTGGGAAPAPSTSAQAAAPQAPVESQTLTVRGLSRGSFFDASTVRELAKALIDHQRNGGKVVLA